MKDMEKALAAVVRNCSLNSLEMESDFCEEARKGGVLHKAINANFKCGYIGSNDEEKNLFAYLVDSRCSLDDTRIAFAIARSQIRCV